MLRCGQTFKIVVVSEAKALRDTLSICQTGDDRDGSIEKVSYPNGLAGGVAPRWPAMKPSQSYLTDSDRNPGGVV
jgi:hypothetical protein